MSLMSAVCSGAQKLAQYDLNRFRRHEIYNKRYLSPEVARLKTIHGNLLNAGLFGACALAQATGFHAEAVTLATTAVGVVKGLLAAYWLLRDGEVNRASGRLAESGFEIAVWASLSAIPYVGPFIAGAGAARATSNAVVASLDKTDIFSGGVVPA
jgi:hypothetical protein